MARDNSVLPLFLYYFYYYRCSNKLIELHQRNSVFFRSLVVPFRDICEWHSLQFTICSFFSSFDEKFRVVLFKKDYETFFKK